MSASSLKQLYVAKCMKDLDSLAKIELKVKNPNLLISSAEKVFKAAEASYIDKDEEKAYVQFTRFIELVLLLRKNKDFANHPDCKSLSRNGRIALARAEDLKVSLLKRYSLLQEANCLATPELEIPRTGDIPELSISSSKLFSLLINQKYNIILMDTRPSKDFEQSRIRHSQCINIPQHLLQPGITTMKLDGILPPESLGKWYMRGEVDHIVLIDWDSKDETSHSLHLEALKQAMSKWDMKCSLKKPPMILQGGYKDWMLKYPMYTTHALNFTSANDFKTSAIIADVSVDRKSKPTIDRSAKTSVGERKNLQTSTSNHSLKDERDSSSEIPVMSRSNSGKASSSSTEEKELMSSLNRESSLAKENLELAKQQLAKEQEFEKLRLQKELVAEESIRQEIQKREEQLAESLKKLEIESRDKDKLYSKLKEENLKLKKLLSENNIKMKDDREVQKQKEEILEAEKQKKAMQEYVEKLRKLRRKKKEIANMRKAELITKTDVIPREVVSANTGLKRNLTDQNSPNSEYTVPLSRPSSSDSVGHGLARSCLSPNIAQMVNREKSSQRKFPVVYQYLRPK